LLDQLGAKVAGVTFLIELAFLGGRKMLGNHKVESILIYH